MKFLFPLTVNAEDVPAIPGLSYLPDYVSGEEEARLVQHIDAGSWDTSWERRRIYGVTYGKVGAVVPPIPSWGRELADRIHLAGVTNRPFDQMLINEYEPGQGIALHKDYYPSTERSYP